MEQHAQDVNPEEQAVMARIPGCGVPVQLLGNMGMPVQYVENSQVAVPITQNRLPSDTLPRSMGRPMMRVPIYMERQAHSPAPFSVGPRPGQDWRPSQNPGQVQWTQMPNVGTSFYPQAQAVLLMPQPNQGRGAMSPVQTHCNVMSSPRNALPSAYGPYCCDEMMSTSLDQRQQACMGPTSSFRSFHGIAGSSGMHVATHACTCPMEMGQQWASQVVFASAQPAKIELPGSFDRNVCTTMALRSCADKSTGLDIHRKFLTSAISKGKDKEPPRKCLTEGCNKTAQGSSQRCKAHGGGRRCRIESCDRAARDKSELCIRHGGGKRCSIVGCTSSARSGIEHCAYHSNQIKKGITPVTNIEATLRSSGLFPPNFL
mmetsp:Transcript_16818/g.36132  ORF Transcript_16818/g.36132 Transcript_16818/m.36132 type:complete len:373 (-) Transcript_16818:447-1565(-)